MRDGSTSSLKVFRPSDGAPGPLLVLCFGGGFIAGDNDQMTETARISVQLFGATVVNISYRVAPEFTFPVQQLDSWDSLEWIANNATGDVLAANPLKGFVLGGVSSGASITAALSRMVQEHKLAYPLTGTSSNTAVSPMWKLYRVDISFRQGQWLAVPSLMDEQSCPQEYRKSWISHDQNAIGHSLDRETRAVMRDAAAWDSTSELRFAAVSKTRISEQPR